MRIASFFCALIFLLAGCGTTREHRIRQYASVFASLPASAQEEVRTGVVQPGQLPVQVYLIHGPPDRNTRYVVPEVNPGDQWTYLGFLDDGVFRSSFDWVWLPRSRQLVTLVVSFGRDGTVENIALHERR